MSKTIIGDGWVILRDAREISERTRRPIIAKATAMQQAAARLVAGIANEGVAEEEFLALYSFNDLVAVAFIKEWSWETPVAVENLLDLPAKAYDEILSVTAPLVTSLMPDFEGTKEAIADPDSPTVPSGA